MARLVEAIVSRRTMATGLSQNWMAALAVSFMRAMLRRISVRWAFVASFSSALSFETLASTARSRSLTSRSERLWLMASRRLATLASIEAMRATRSPWPDERSGRETSRRLH